MRKQEIEWILRQMGWTQADAAEKLGYSLSHFKNILSGQRSMPDNIKAKLKKAVESEIKLNTKKYSNLKATLECQEGNG